MRLSRYRHSSTAQSSSPPPPSRCPCIAAGTETPCRSPSLARTDAQQERKRDPFVAAMDSAYTERWQARARARPPELSAPPRPLRSLDARMLQGRVDPGTCTSSSCSSQSLSASQASPLQIPAWEGPCQSPAPPDPSLHGSLLLSARTRARSLPVRWPARSPDPQRVKRETPQPSRVVRWRQGGEHSQPPDAPPSSRHTSWQGPASRRGRRQEQPAAPFRSHQLPPSGRSTAACTRSSRKCSLPSPLLRYVSSFLCLRTLRAPAPAPAPSSAATARCSWHA
mmetsp:Transcript_44538/g.140524  ORF Transcript_44538/g.140524 Transcript_44538/m.140524 type:complete len:281 (+) Transcript_44538:1934-2776(+)